MATMDVTQPIAEIRAKLPTLPFKYPITSAAELKAAPTKATFSAGGRVVQLDDVLPQLSAKSYPIASAADLEQKVNGFVTLRAAAASKGLDKLRAQLPRLSFPIASAAQLVQQMSARKYTLDGKPVDASKAVGLMPAADFPIASEADFESKTSSVAFHVALTTRGPRTALR